MRVATARCAVRANAGQKRNAAACAVWGWQGPGAAPKVRRHRPPTSSPRTVTDGSERAKQRQTPCPHETRGMRWHCREEYRTRQNVAALAPDGPVERRRRLRGGRSTTPRPMTGLPGSAVCICPKPGDGRQIGTLPLTTGEVCFEPSPQQSADRRQG